MLLRGRTGQVGGPHGEGLGLVEAGLLARHRGHAVEAAGLVPAVCAGLAGGAASAGARQRRHVLGRPPEGGDDAVVGGGHQDDRQQEDDHHLVRGHRHAPRGSGLAARSKVKSGQHSTLFRYLDSLHSLWFSVAADKYRNMRRKSSSFFIFRRKMIK